MENSTLQNIYYKNPNLIIGLISKYYNFNTHEIINYYYKINKHSLFFLNKNVDWNNININKLEELNHFGKYIGSSIIPFNCDNLIKYAEYLDYYPYSLDPIYQDENELTYKDIYNDNNVEWNEKSIDSLKNKINWQGLSSSKTLNFTSSLILRFVEYWDWVALSKNNSINWDIDSLFKFKDFIHWGIMSSNNSLLKLKINDLKKLENYLDWQFFFRDQPFSDKDFEEVGIFSDYFFALSTDDHKWFHDFLTNFLDLKIICFYPDSEKLSSDEWDSSYNPNKLYYSDLEYFLEKYKKRWEYINGKKSFYDDDYYESYNEYISITFIENYDILSKINHDLDYGEFNEFINNIPDIISSNENVKGLKFWNLFDFIINWDIFSKNYNFPLNIDFLNTYKKKINWELLSSNNQLNWNSIIIIKFSDFINFNNLSSNYFIKWENILFELFKEKWNWVELSKNFSIRWDPFLIDKYSDLLDFKELSLNKNIKWENSLIEKYSDKWDFNLLLYNDSFPWNDDLIVKYIDKLNFNENCKEDKIKYFKRIIDNYKNLDNNYESLENTKIDQYINDLIATDKNIHWSESFIEQNKDVLNWKSISNNNKAIFTLEQIDKFAENIIVTDNVWEIVKPHLNNEFIQKIFDYNKNN